MNINFNKFKENKSMINKLITIERYVKWIDNKLYRPEETKILTDVFPIRHKRKCCSLYQGSYPVYCSYNPTVAVVAENKYNFGSEYYIILGGYDGVLYKDSIYNTVETWMGENLIDVEFEGDFSTIKTFKSKKELNEFLEEITWFDLALILKGE